MSAGCTGDTGPAGESGAPGIDCWDLNGNGECDPDSEDYTDDGTCDVQDCRGADGGGSAGPACWDLDESLSCDPDTEDFNGDGECTVADCAGVTVGVLSGTVTNDGGDALSGVAITLFPAVTGMDHATDDSGAFTIDLPVGSYAVTFELDGYESLTVTAPIAADETTELEVTLVPTDGVTVDAGGEVTGAPGDTGSTTATVTVRDGSSVDSYSWTHVHGPELTVSGETTDTLSATFADAATYRAELLSGLHFADNRLQVLGINHFAIHEAAVSVYEVTVTTSSGTYTDTVDFHADLPYDVATGLVNVPVGEGVLLFTPEDAAGYTWSLTAPGGSSAALDATDTQTVVFTPDVVGDYTVTANGTDIVVRADEWVGAVGGIGADGNVTGKSACTGCHSGTIAPDMFSTWRESGHAEIFKTNLNTSGHYGERCFDCHTVGYNPDVDNGGIEEASDYTDFVDDILHHGPDPDNYATMETATPNAFAYTNIQCENCHGPNPASHGSASPGRVSISSDVCASCHGEPKRHARFQQWALSGHGNYPLATGRGSRGSCAACHSGQGFISAVDEWETTGTWPSTPADVPTAEEAHPITCVTCHDPHMPGTMSGDPNNATVRIQGNTPELAAGFTAIGVGRGAICMTCHNSRRGLANDSIGSTPAGGRAPHGPTQADVLMGQNVFFVDVGARSGHAYLADTCTTCHMQRTPPPDALSYNLGGTNHTFGASVEICGDCHGEFDGEGLTSAFEMEIHRLAEHLGEFAASHLNTFSSIDVVAVDLTDGASSEETTIDLTAVTITEAHVTEGHGRMELDLVFDSAVSLEFGATAGADTRSLTEFAVQLRNLEVGGTSTVIFTDSSNYNKAQWNYHILHNDSSHGVHNPSFVNSVLVNTMSVDLSVGVATP